MILPQIFTDGHRLGTDYLNYELKITNYGGYLIGQIFLFAGLKIREIF